MMVRQPLIGEFGFLLGIITPSFEKELLAIVYACEKFDQHIFGRSDVIVESDHKSKETIFKKPIHSSPKRVQRMRLRLQNYDI